MTINLADAPPAPSLSDPANFEDRCSAFLAWMATIAGQIDGQVLELSDFVFGGGPNGYFSRSPQGTQICWAQVAVDLTSSAAQDFTMPALFSDNPAPGAAVSRSGLSWPGSDNVALRGMIVSANSGTWRFNCDGSGSSSTFQFISLTAIGRWN